MRVHSQITNSQQRGSALTEFAIMVPLFLAMIYGSIFLSDLGAVRLKAQEIARFLTWSFSVQPLSDFSEFKHSTLFSEARTRSETQVWELYSDLDSASDRVIPVAGKTQQSMLAVYVPPTASDMRNLKVQMVPEAGNVEFAEPLSG
ncbi:pilus assembly protein, partial [Myxococcota bacterium]|nr:pilus assembly protein [Myxococcota bacterium]